MKLFDSHCHLDDRSYVKDLNEVGKRAVRAGVDSIMIVGVDLKTSRRAVELTERQKGYYASVGVHPHDARHCTEKTLRDLMGLAKHSKVRAWGETGLDFNRMYSPREDQEKWFQRQLEIARELDLPLIFHERDSEGRFLEIIRKKMGSEIDGVVHCFSGDRKELDQYLELGLHIGITGILTIKKRGAGLRELAAQIPDSKILIETDAPYLTPAPEKNRVRRNEPAFVKSVLLKLAEIRGQDPEALSQIIWENTCRLYRIKAQSAGCMAHGVKNK